VWWWKEANTTKWLFRKFAVIELHQCFRYLVVSRRSWWYVDEVEGETEKRDDERYLCTVGIWNYSCPIEISPHSATWTLLHWKHRFVENRFSLIAKSGSVLPYTLGGSIAFSEVCLSQNLCRNLLHNSLSTVVFSKDADESYAMFFGRQYELLLRRAVWDEGETVRN
jgi:hypothetical protein